MSSRKIIRTSATLLLSCALIGAGGAADAAKSDQLSNRDMSDKESAKNANDTAAQAINGEKPKDTLSQPATADQKEKAKKTAASVNQVPGVKVAPADLEPPTQPPIKGFHPIKKLLRPVENLEGMSIKLEQEIMKLEGPIAGLQPPMLHLEDKMNSVDSQLGSMQGQLNATQTEVKGVRSDIAGMRKDIQSLKSPLTSLQKPIEGVSKPLEEVQQQLNIVIMAIFAAALAIAVGTPIAAVVLYKYRDKFFPGLAHELPETQTKDAKDMASSNKR